MAFTELLESWQIMGLGKAGPAASGGEAKGWAFKAFAELLESWQIMGLGKTGPGVDAHLCIHGIHRASGALADHEIR